jgi:hypothetical protein
VVWVGGWGRRGTDRIFDPVGMRRVVSVCARERDGSGERGVVCVGGGRRTGGWVVRGGGDGIQIGSGESAVLFKSSERRACRRRPVDTVGRGCGEG